MKTKVDELTKVIDELTEVIENLKRLLEQGSKADTWHSETWRVELVGTGRQMRRAGQAVRDAATDMPEIAELGKLADLAGWHFMTSIKHWENRNQEKFKRFFERGIENLAELEQLAIKAGTELILEGLGTTLN